MIAARRTCTAVIALAAIASLSVACSETRRASTAVADTTLTIGFGLTSGQSPLAGMNQVIGNVALEGLVSFLPDGRYRPWLAKEVTASADGLVWQITLRPGVKFHNGAPADAKTIRSVLLEQMPRIGSAFGDVKEIVAVSDERLEVRLNKRSTLVLEGFGGAIQTPGAPNVGTGPFAVSGFSGELAEMRSNPNYYEGAPNIARILIKPYSTVRAAWADMLRRNVDMLYEAGVDALDSLEPSSSARVFVSPRPYCYVVIFNVQRPLMRNPAFRRDVSSAIDREKFVRDALDGHGKPAVTPVRPDHWANDPSLPSFAYAPHPITSGGPGAKFTLLYTEPSSERLALVVQRMLAGVGVSVTLEFSPLDDALKRMASGDFDAWLADVVQGPGFLRPSWFWYTGDQYNWGHYSDPTVDAAFDTIRGASNDAEYKSGVAAFQRGMVANPPAIFLAWSERARAVSTRFEVPVEQGRDILSTLRLWRPLTGSPTASPN